MQTNREAAMEFVRGSLVALIVPGVIFIIVLITSSPQSPSKGDPSRFQIVDKYKGCDVIRWEQKGLAEYKYFLHCSENRP